MATISSFISGVQSASLFPSGAALGVGVLLIVGLGLAALNCLNRPEKPAEPLQGKVLSLTVSSGGKDQSEGFISKAVISIENASEELKKRESSHSLNSCATDGETVSEIFSESEIAEVSEEEGIDERRTTSSTSSAPASSRGEKAFCLRDCALRDKEYAEKVKNVLKRLLEEKKHEGKDLAILQRIAALEVTGIAWERLPSKLQNTIESSQTNMSTELLIGLQERGKSDLTTLSETAVDSLVQCASNQDKRSYLLHLIDENPEKNLEEMVHFAAHAKGGVPSKDLLISLKKGLTFEQFQRFSNVKRSKFFTS